MEGDNAEAASLNNKRCVLDSTISMFVFYVWGVLLLEEGGAGRRREGTAWHSHLCFSSGFPLHQSFPSYSNSSRSHFFPETNGQLVQKVILIPCSFN